MEISSMLDRLSRDGFPEIAGNEGFKVSEGLKVSEVSRSLKP
jgi:hypothetical protein